MLNILNINILSETFFTLIELITVVIVISVVMAISTPKLADFYRGTKLNQTARQMMIYIASARDRAVYENCEHRISVDEFWNTLSLSRRDDTDLYHDEFYPVDGRLGRYDIPSGISISEIEVDGNSIARGGHFEIEILPIASMEEIVFALKDNRENAIQVVIEAGSGAVKLVEQQAVNTER